MAFGVSNQRGEVGKLQTLDLYMGHSQSMVPIEGLMVECGTEEGGRWNASPTKFSLLDKFIRVLYQTHHNRPDMTTR